MCVYIDTRFEVNYKRSFANANRNLHFSDLIQSFQT